MTKMDLQRFSENQEESGLETPEETPSQESAQAGEESRAPFSQLIQGAYKEDYENAVGRRIQAAIQQRFKNQQDMKKQLDAYEPIVKKAAEHFQVAPEDLDALKSKLEGEKKASEEQESAPDHGGDDIFLRRHFEKLVTEGNWLRRVFPGFDLEKEMQNPAFFRMTLPGSGMTVKDAFFALHGEDIQRQSILYAARQATERIAQSVRSGAARPMENGMEAPGAADLTLDIQHMDKKDREMYRRRIRNGETIDFIKNI